MAAPTYPATTGNTAGACSMPRASERFRSLMFTDGGDDFYGVIRIDVMRRIAPHNSYHNAGRKLVAELSLYGRFQQVPEVMFWRRQHAGRGDNLGSIKRVCTVPTWTRAGGATQQHACWPRWWPRIRSRSIVRHCLPSSGAAVTRCT